MADRLDIIIFGASGFTGKYCIPEVDKFSKAEGRSLTWGISGRSEEKLKKALQEMGTKIDKDLESIPIIVADIKDKDALKRMTARAKVVINCCGPYRFFGEPVVEACVETGTHHVDVSGEPQFLESVQLKYNDACKEKGIYIVGSCGFDSIPADLGVIFLEKKFEGTLNSVETYLEMQSEDSLAKGPQVNYGTYETLVYSVAHTDELKSLRQKFPKLPPLEPKLESRGYIHQSDITRKWTLPFLGADRSVIIRTQRYLYEHEKKRPVQVQTYFSLNSFLQVIAFIIFGAIFGILTRFKIGVSLLLQYPGLFTFGFFKYKEGPSEEQLRKQKFSITFYGKGWSEKLAEPEDKYDKPPNKEIIARVSGTNPAYGSTCLALVLSAITIITEPSRLPEKGGVFSPGAAFAKTSLIDQLDRNGLKYEVISVKDI